VLLQFSCPSLQKSGQMASRLGFFRDASVKAWKSGSPAKFGTVGHPTWAPNLMGCVGSWIKLANTEIYSLKDTQQIYHKASVTWETWVCIKWSKYNQGLIASNHRTEETDLRRCWTTYIYVIIFIPDFLLIGFIDLKILLHD
jgi:hypothetical protein